MKRSLLFAPLALLSALISVPLASAQTPASCGRALTAQERIALREIQARIDEGIETQLAKDISALMRHVTADYLVALTDGTTLNRAQVEADLRRDSAWILSVSDETRIRIVCLTLKGSEATVLTDQHYVRTVPDRKDGSPHELITNITHRETWIYTANGWTTKHIQELKQGPTLLDGELYDP